MRNVGAVEHSEENLCFCYENPAISDEKHAAPALLQVPKALLPCRAQGAEQHPARGCAWAALPCAAGMGAPAWVSCLFGFQLWLWKMPALPSFPCALADVSQLSLTWSECPAATLALCLTPSNFVALHWRGTAAFGKTFIIFFWVLKLTYQWAPRNHCLKLFKTVMAVWASNDIYIFILKTCCL